ncbi:extracellular solute-binding protein [Streptomyces sp. NPDC097640]|uniref:ABC transporter substrate-binding protein n=1 Tax=Streptomyces sp. NPDC097640 TaxID=3157229 RepID=UPI0033182EA7
MPTRRAASLAVALACAVGPTACSAGAATAPPSRTDAADIGGSAAQARLDKLYKAAQAEHRTQVLVYGPSQNFYAGAYRAFQERYPAITIIPQPIFGPQLTTKLAEEFASGKHAASLQTNGGSGIALSDQAGQCRPYKPFTAAYLSPDQVGPNDSFAAFVRFAVGIEYNTDKLTARQAPRSWTELARPAWRGRLVQADPANVGVTSLMISHLTEARKLNTDWTGRLLDNSPQTVDTAALAEQSLARGEREVMVADNSAVYAAARAKNLPVGFVFPTEEGARFDTQYLCLLKGAPAPEAAQLLVNWLHTEEGQRALAGAGLYGTRPQTPAPDGLPPLSRIQSRIIPEIPPGRQAEAVNRTIAVVKRLEK